MAISWDALFWYSTTESDRVTDMVSLMALAPTTNPQGGRAVDRSASPLSAMTGGNRASRNRVDQSLDGNASLPGGHLSLRRGNQID